MRALTGPPPEVRDNPVLVVDDNPPNLRLVSILLQSDGLAVRTAATAERALELLAGERFSLVLVDIQLPGMSGLDLTRRIRNTPAWAATPVVALTASAMSGDEALTLAAGCDGYIGKPIDVRAFAAKVREYLRPGDGGLEALGKEICLLRNEFLVRAREEARTLLSLPDSDLGGPPAFQTFHRWAGFGGSVGLDRLTDLARDAERHVQEPLGVRGPLVRQTLTSILDFLESVP